MTRRFVQAGLVLIGGLLAVTPAAAQPPASTVFVSAAALAVIDDTSHTGGFAFDAPTNGRSTVAGGAIALGVHLTPRVSARVEVNIADRAKTETFLPGILGGGFPTGLGTPFTLNQKYVTTRKSTPIFALLAYHLPAGRLTVEIVGGLGIVHQKVTSSFESSITVPGSGGPFGGPGLGGSFLPTPIREEFRASGYDAVAVAGADFAVAATNRLAVVPQVRAYVLNGGLSLRPGLGLRWTF